MASTARISAPPLPAVQRYFEVSLFLLVSTGILAIVSTGKLDPLSTIVPIIALAYKAIRIWRGRGPELSVACRHLARAGLFPVFPIRPLGLLAQPRRRRAEPRALCRAARRHSPAAFRDVSCASFPRAPIAITRFSPFSPSPRMLASAILTVETGFLVALAIFLVLAVSTFVALEIRRGAQ